MKRILLPLCLGLLTVAALAADPPPGPADPADAEAVPPETVAPPRLTTPAEAGVPEDAAGRLEREIFRRERPVEYSSRGRRDPFRALLTDQRGDGEIKTDLLVLDGATLTGVVWSNDEFMAMVKDKNGVSFFLHEGDRVYSGRLASISQTEAVFEIASFGSYDRVVLKVRS